MASQPYARFRFLIKASIPNPRTKGSSLFGGAASRKYGRGIPDAPRKTWGIKPFAEANRDASTVNLRLKNLDSRGFGPIRFLI